MAVNQNNLKQTPIPVVPRNLKIVNPDGTVTRGGQLLLEQLQAAIATAGGGDGTGTGPGTGNGGTGAASPSVTIDAPADVIPRSDGKVQVDIHWIKAKAATKTNFQGAAVYVEDPDISSGSQAPLDGSTQLNGNSQVSGTWQPVFYNNSETSPAVVLIDRKAGDRDVRFYLVSYAPNAAAGTPNRANGADPSPNIMVDIPGATIGQSGQEYAFLISDPGCIITTDYNRPDPNYYLTFSYTPPDPATPVPSSQQAFAGVRIVFIPEDSSGNPNFSDATDASIEVPVQWDQGFKSPIYTPAPAGSQFRCYFCSEDVDGHCNSLVEGVTPYVEVVVPPLPSIPSVTNFKLVSQDYIWPGGVLTLEATFSWDFPDSPLYAGVELYLVDVTGSGTPLTAFPTALTGPLANVDTNFVLDITNIPLTPETWIVAAISVSVNGTLAEDPSTYDPSNPSAFKSPTLQWIVGPPTPGSPGSGIEFAPLVTIDAGATVTPTQTLSADGVGMVSFDVGTWTDPKDNSFGGAQVAMVINYDTTKPTYWSVPGNANSFTTPTMPTFGNFGAQVPVDFYIVSDDPAGDKNSIVPTTPGHPGTTPVISYMYTPTEGAIIPARDGWFDPTQFAWDTSGQLQATLSAEDIQVGKTLVVGGAPASFGGNQNGQIAVEDSSGNLLAWMGEQQPNQGQQGNPLYGAWFKQIWIGGTSPLNAPIFTDYQGIFVAGGIAAQSGSQYPYISVRDQHGYECGRIGASITTPTGSSSDNTGGTPAPGTPLASLTSGAWFTQLAVGGSNLANWCMLITPQSSNPLGSNVLMRNIYSLSIDYPALTGSQSMAHYTLEFGNSVWMAGGLSGAWVFPGIHIYEPDHPGSQPNFGATFLSRGMVLRGTAQQNYPVLVSLVTWNGDQNGSDYPHYFWGDFAMASAYGGGSAYQTVHIASGSATGGDPDFAMFNHNNLRLFEIDGNGNVYVLGVMQNTSGGGINAISYTVNGFGQVVDNQGNWTGKAISSSQTPWAQDIQGNAKNLNNAGNIFAAQYYAQANQSGPVINNYGQFTGFGIAIGGQGIGCGGIAVTATNANGNTGDGGITCVYLRASTTINASGTVTAQGLTASGPVACQSVTVNNNLALDGGGNYVGPSVNTPGRVTASDITINHSLTIAGVQCVNNNGIWVGAGVQSTSYVFGGQFGIEGQVLGQPTPPNIETITVVTDAATGATTTLKFCGGIYVGH